MRMTWHDLLFMHWPVSPDALRPWIPAGLELETFDGWAWLGIVPFRMTGVGPRVLPRFAASAFPELNVRTYIRHKERFGVWFFSLDAADRMAVWAARRFFHLPYWLAVMSCARENALIRYESRRTADPEVALRCQYQPTGAEFQSVPGSFEYWLTARYCLFSANKRGELFCGEIHHEPWSLQPAEAETSLNTMASPLRVNLDRDRTAQPILHFARRLDVVAWSLEKLTV
jgi:uncharacterized protein YqjF (DUF2071 family)